MWDGNTDDSQAGPSQGGDLSNDSDVVMVDE